MEIHWIKFTEEGDVVEGKSVDWAEPLKSAGIFIPFPSQKKDGWVSHYRIDINGRGDYRFEQSNGVHCFRRRLRKNEVSYGMTKQELLPDGTAFDYHLLTKEQVSRAPEDMLIRPIDEELLGQWFSIFVSSGGKVEVAIVRDVWCHISKEAIK